jgi:hypothetical protein
MISERIMDKIRDLPWTGDRNDLYDQISELFSDENVAKEYKRWLLDSLSKLDQEGPPKDLCPLYLPSLGIIT